LLFCWTKVPGLGWRDLQRGGEGDGALPLDLPVGKTAGLAGWKCSESRLLAVVVLSHASALKHGLPGNWVRVCVPDVLDGR